MEVCGAGECHMLGSPRPPKEQGAGLGSRARMGLRAILQAILVGLPLPQLPIAKLSPLVPLPFPPLTLGTRFPVVPLTLQVWVGHWARIHEVLKVSGKDNYHFSSSYSNSSL